MFELKCETVIAAPRERVWDVLTDFATYPQWNALVRSFEGELRVGAPFKALFEPMPGRTLSTTVHITVCEPPHRIGWGGKTIASWLIRGEHVYTLEREGSGTRLINREVFEGLLVPLVKPMLARSLPAYHANSEAIRKRAEAGPPVRANGPA